MDRRREEAAAVVATATLYDALADTARADPARPALVFDAGGAARAWSYAELAEDVDRTAGGLLERGLEPGDRVLLSLENHPEILRVLLAASKTGVIAVPVDPSLTARELQHVFALCKPALALADAGAATVRAVAEAAATPVVAATDPLGAPSLAAAHADAEAAQTDPRAVVELLFTSGTTNAPKAVMLTNAALLHGARSLAAGAGYCTEDRALITLPLYHAAAQIHQFLPTLVLGGSVVVARRFSPGSFFSSAAAFGTSTSAQFAATLRLLLRRGDESAARECGLRHVTFAQSLTLAEYDEWAVRFGIPLQQLWGMTETTGLPLMSPLDGDRNLAAMGVEMSGFYEVAVARADGSRAGADEPGELVVAANPGENVMLGYFDDPAATDATIRDGWLHSGDMARRDEHGFFYFLGRGRDLIRRAGQSFSALEVEEVLLAHPGVVDAAVVGIPDALADERVGAFVVLGSPAPSLAELRRHCRGLLAPHKRPDMITIRSELPRTSVGKIQKHLLPTPDA